MTGGRPGRDPRASERRERGPRRGEAPPGEARWTGTGGAELEELHVGALTWRRSSRVGVRTAIVGVALVGLFATGLGAFGGRLEPGASPGSRAVAEASGSPLPTIAFVVAATPKVTPFAPCSPASDVVPRVWLDVDGEEYAGALELLAVDQGRSPAPEMPRPTRAVPEITIGTNAATTIVVAGSTCALGWVIDFDGRTTLDVLANGAMDPAYAAQNRFELPLAAFPGRDALLRAQLMLPELSVRASWAVEIDRLEHPIGKLHWLDNQVTTAVEGCDVAIETATGWREPTDACDVRETPFDEKTMGLHSNFTFELSGWDVELNGFACGHAVDEAFVYAEPSCEGTVDNHRGVITVDFTAAVANEVWTLAIFACGTGGPTGDAALCGTWYANVRPAR